MIISKRQFEAIKEFSYERIKKNDKFHQKYHIDQTVRLAVMLARKERADVQKSAVIAYLHDIAKHKETKTVSHSDFGAVDAKSFLEKIGLKNDDIEDICYAIREHSKDGEKRTKEAEVIYDADKLQAVGAYGIVRALSYNLDVVYPDKNQNRLFLETIKELEFFSKRLYTRTGKKFAKKSNGFMKRFVKDYIKVRDANF